MYLKSLTIKNFRKFGNNDDNTVYFVATGAGGVEATEAAEADDVEATETDGVEATEADGVGATEADSIEATEADSIEATESDGVGATEADSVEATETDGNSAIVPTGLNEQEESEKETQNNVASATTLIVGKNNSGKTTVTKALEKLIDEGTKIIGNDFNFVYLNDFLNNYDPASQQIPLPFLSFKLAISIEINKSNIISNFKPFIDIGTVSDAKLIDLDITIKYVVNEAEKFKTALTIIKNKYHEPKLCFKKFIELIDKTEFKIKYFGVDGKEVKNSKLKINNLLGIKSISANKNLHATNLSSVFNKIIKNRYKSDRSSRVLESLIDEIDNVNRSITNEISQTHNTSVNGVLQQVESSNRLGVELSSDLNFDKLMRNLIKYEYNELGLSIPENQFGLGYTNLMNIIGEIIDYVEQYPDGAAQSKINLICIEEPETFMHPQMQEFFIRYIDDAVSYLLETSVNKNINSQLIITTHSSHILNSKIHSSNSFDNINYISTTNGKSTIVRLDDAAVSSDEEYVPNNELEITKAEFDEKKLNDLKFLKTHIKYKVSELFFSDCIIFVEGVTEDVLLNYYIDKDDNLNKYYISIFNINGAHASVYFPLIKLLKIPALIVTDLDIKRTEGEKESFTQISDLSDRTTTNNTIKIFNSGSDDISVIENYFSDSNCHCIFQKNPIENQFATSFEEAFILHNYNNEIVNKVLKSIKPRIYKNIVGDNNDHSKLIINSYKLQKKLTKSKSDFANEMLYELIINNNSLSLPTLPQYIQDGLSWLKNYIEPSTTAQGEA